MALFAFGQSGSLAVRTCPGWVQEMVSGSQNSLLHMSCPHSEAHSVHHALHRSRIQQPRNAYLTYAVVATVKTAWPPFVASLADYLYVQAGCFLQTSKSLDKNLKAPSRRCYQQYAKGRRSSLRVGAEWGRQLVSMGNKG